jgi:hypothetical protein
MQLEQDRGVKTDASIISNHVGSGVLPSAIYAPVLFDSDNMFPDQVALVASKDFDGTGLRPLLQPSDPNLGNQLEVEYTDSDIFGMATAFGRLSVKALIIGLDFQGNTQYDRFYFHTKEKQVTRKHYAKILSVLFNDFLGNSNCSRTLGGRVIIREAESFELSRDPIMISQDLSPNLFFRDFKISNFSTSPNPTVTLYQTLQEAMGSEYTVDSLNINTTVKRNVYLAAGDVTTKLAQKFQASTDNIQKISILLGVDENTTVSDENKFDWSGEFVVSVYALQTTVSNPSDLVPQLAIEFDPNPEPITQFTFDQESLRDLGYVLNNVLQPVDFIFGASALGNKINPVVVPGKYYAISICRAGDTTNGNIFTGVGNSFSTADRFSIFSGIWSDVPSEDMWYQVWTDAAKVADGQAYDGGNGVQIPKTIVNSVGATVDNSLSGQSFNETGQNTLNTAVVEAVLTPSGQEQDERTGSPVYSRQQFEAAVSFVSSSSLTTLKESGDPLIIGCARDTNPKSNSIIKGIQNIPGLTKGNTFKVVNPDPNLLSQQLVGSKLIPNDDCEGLDYRIFEVRVCLDGYGDVNGDGIIDQYDVYRASELLSESIYSSTTQQKIIDGYIDPLELLRADVNGDGFVTAEDINLISAFVSRTITSFPVGTSFRHIELVVQESIGRYDGYFDCGDGYVRLDGYVGKNVIPIEDLNQYDLVYDGYNSPVNMELNDPIFRTVPFSPIPYKIRPQAFWQDWLVQFSSEARIVPAVFTSFVEEPKLRDSHGQCLEASLTLCEDPLAFGSPCNPGKNDFLIPDNLFIKRGQILNADGTFFKQDFEIGIINIELPQEQFIETPINVFEKFVCNSAGNGFTTAGFKAMKFADCSWVEPDAILKNQVRFGVALQSIVPNSDGYDPIDGYGIIIDELVGVYMDNLTGIMTLSMKDLLYEPVYRTLVTRIEVTVYLKKAGWNNQMVYVTPDQVAGLFL